MSLKFFNTMTRRNEEFTPIDPQTVRMYTCGPTVYNYAHIGNLRAYIFEDQLRRHLKYKGYNVVQVMNLTDVDDKIIRNCTETGVPLYDYTAPYKEAFFRHLKMLNIEPAEFYPEATAHIPEMEAMIRRLLEKGHAYTAQDGNIFFKISSFPDYGKLQHLDMDNMRTGDRVSNDEYEKESVHDFALWKAWKPGDGDVYWDSDLGKGRPGWHIECSAMSTKYLGETFDIHTGGVDNIFPHHENEIAQSECAHDRKFVNYWLHCEHLIWDNEKMSKSLGNIIYLETLQERGYAMRAVRYALLSTHYRQKLNFSTELLDTSARALQRIDDFLFETGKHNSPGPVSETVMQLGNDLKNQFEEAMDDDLNISRALGTLFEYIRSVNIYRRDHSAVSGDRDNILEALKKIDGVLGVIFTDTRNSAAVDENWIQARISERNRAREDRDWALADRIRDELKELGIELLDRKDGTDYRLI